jgi:hypothetical protein
MATKVKAVNRIAELNGKHEAPQEAVKLPPIQKMRVRLKITGTSPLIQHAWAEKAKAMIRDKHAGKKTKTRDIRDPQKEGEDAAYYTQDGKYGVPAMAIKSALIGAAHKDIGVEKTVVKKALFIECQDRNNVLVMDCDEPEIREDMVRVGMGGTDLRYRPYYFRWSVELVFLLDAGWLQVADLCNLVDRAGFGVGIGEWRPEKGGDFGRFELDRTSPVETEVVA